MNKFKLVAIILLISLSNILNAQKHYKTGVGAKAGSSYLVGTYKTFLFDNVAAEGFAGFGYGRVNNGISIGASLQWTYPLENDETYEYYFGPATMIELFQGNPNLGLGGVIGIEKGFKEYDFSIFVEAMPIIHLNSEGLTTGLNLGGRYFLEK